MTTRTPLDALSSCRLARLIRVERHGGNVGLDLRMSDGETQLTLEFGGVSELSLAPTPEAPSISDPAALSALELQIHHVSIRPSAGIAVFAWAPGAHVRGGVLHLDATSVQIRDAAGAAMTSLELRELADRLTRARREQFSAADYRKSFDRVLKQHVRPLLAAAGFTPSKRAFIRARNGLVDLVQVELGAWASGDSADFKLSFSVNQGDAGGPKPSEATVAASSYPAHFMTLLPAYSLAGQVDEAALAVRLRDDVELHALPFFARFPDVDAAIAALVEEDRRTDHGQSYALGNLLARLGRIDEAREYFRVAKDSRIAIVNAAKHYGISLDD